MRAWGGRRTRRGERRASHPHETQQQKADPVLDAKPSVKVAAVLRKVGRPKAGEGNGANSTVSRGSTQAAYLAARLRRDHPDAVFDESVCGSVRQAAIAAGIVVTSVVGL